MQKDTPQNNNPAPAAESPNEALKKAQGPAKGGGKTKEARLAAALRENLRRRKAARASIARPGARSLLKDQ